MLEALLWALEAFAEVLFWRAASDLASDPETDHPLLMWAAALLALTALQVVVEVIPIEWLLGAVGILAAACLGAAAWVGFLRGNRAAATALALVGVVVALGFGGGVWALHAIR